MIDEIDTGERCFQGVAVSSGISIGPLHAITEASITPDSYRVDVKSIPQEIERLRKALAFTKKQLSQLESRIRAMSGEDEARIFEAHLMVLEDKSLVTKVLTRIEEQQINAEYAFFAVMQNFLEAMRRVPDPYLAERTIDLEDVCQRVLVNFSQDAEHQPLPEAPSPQLQHVLIAHDLTPSDTAIMDRTRVMGFATERGSINSHTAILARSLGIPAIVDLGDTLISLRTLTPCILDGYSGKFIVNPTAETTAQYIALKLEKEAAREKLDSQKNEPAITADGYRITLSANIEFNHELEAANHSGAEGIGLYRTEFFLLDGDEMPDEEEQTAAYIEAVKASAPHEVIFRTLDAGGDKLPAEPLAEPEPNPFLGWRGIRVSLTRPEMFRAQLRAILRASAYGKVGVMFPFISGVAEIREAIRHLRECKEELVEAKVPVGDTIEIGAMIEIPSAAIVSHHMAQEVDFFSIGTNDLVQYTLAVDRVNGHVASLYNPSHPSVLELIRITLQASDSRGIWTGVCGEMAADPLLIPLLIAMGVQELSVGTNQVSLVKKAIRTLKKSECDELLAKINQLTTSEEVNTATRLFAEKHYPELLNN